MSKNQEIKFDARNYRIHNDKNKKLISNSLKELGTGRSIIIDAENEIIGGNGVYAEAKKLNIPVKIIETNGKELIALKRTDLKTNDEKRKKLAILDNSTTDTSEFNMALLQEDYTPQELQDLGVEIEITDVPVEQVEEDDIPEPEEVETRSSTGDLWKLGDHYLFVGDSTKQEDIDKLMQGHTADMIMTDPPYNVAVQNSQGMKIQNDDMSDNAFNEFLDKLFEVMATKLKPGGAFYVWHGDNARVEFETNLKKHGLPTKETLIWAKNHFNLGRQDYQHQTEPCLYGFKEGAAHYFIEEYNHSTLIEELEKTDIDKLSKEKAIELLKRIYKLPTTLIRADKPIKNDLHPTMKNVKMLAMMIRNSSRPGEIVLDVCGGSGSTLMACEQLGRKCFINEIDPKYADVIIQRWENFTGQKAELVVEK